MNDEFDLHAPTAEFRHRLEDALITRFRAEGSEREVGARERRRPWLRTAATILISLGIGVAAGAGSAQVREDQQRQRLLEVAQSELTLAQRRVEFARADVEKARQSVQLGFGGMERLREAEAGLAEMEARLERVRLDIEETRRSAIPPRDDLGAPLVAGSDFVKRRLEAEMKAAEARLRAAEQLLESRRHAVDVGATPQSAALQAQAEAEQAEAALGMVLQKLELRELALRERLSAQEVARRQQRLELQTQLQVAERLAAISAERVAELRARERLGVIDHVDVLRVELEAAELNAQIERLNAELQRMR